MSNNGQRLETQENREQTFTGDSDIYEQEPGEITEENPPISGVSTQQSNTQPTVADVLPAVFIGHTARRIRLESLVSDYRDGTKTKEETLTEIHNVLDRGPQLSEEEKETTLRLYTEEIDSAEERARRGLAAGEPSVPRAS